MDLGFVNRVSERNNPSFASPNQIFYPNVRAPVLAAGWLQRLMVELLSSFIADLKQATQV